MKKRKIQLSEIEKNYDDLTYMELYEVIIKQIEMGILIPIKAANVNGKKPALFNAYWMIEEDDDYGEILEEMKYRLHPLLDMSYYIKNPNQYIKDRDNILQFSKYLSESQENLKFQETMNERSFEIFNQEKYLHDEGGLNLLKKLQFYPENLNFYQTTEPLSYYAHSKRTPQNFLIIENKDTFYSMRKHLIDGNDKILGLEVATLVYGAGKGISKSFDDYVYAVEPYFSDIKNKVYYFGDLDYEGISIYESLAERFRDKVQILLFSNAYEKMIEKAKKIGFDKMPQTKKGQKEREGKNFFSQFEENMVMVMRQLLRNRQYIPQEILNRNDF